jgi:hypothetical protein
MERIVRISIIVVLLATSIAVLGCSRTVIRAGGSSGTDTGKGKGRTTDTVQNDKKGPPPHAPAHGYRHKHADGVVLVFEAGLGVYVVSGHKDLYYYKERYYRQHNKNWQSSGHFEGPWRKSPDNKVPPGLQENVAEADEEKGNGKDKDKDNGKGKGNNK